MTDFYMSKGWRILREKVLRIYGNECMNCGLSPNETGKSPHVDHIKPRSLYPHLEMEIKNMQVLCEECNTKIKSTHVVDYRTNQHLLLLEKFLKNGRTDFSVEKKKKYRRKKEHIIIECKKEIIEFEKKGGKKRYNRLLREYGEDMVLFVANNMK